MIPTNNSMCPIFSFPFVVWWEVILRTFKSLVLEITDYLIRFKLTTKKQGIFNNWEVILRTFKSLVLEITDYLIRFKL